MKYLVYSIEDKVACEAGPLFQAKNDNVARRQFENIISGQKLNAEDYQLICLGSFDSETSELVATPGPREISDIYDIKIALAEDMEAKNEAI